MFFKIKAIATICLVKDGQKEIESLKTVKLQVASGTTVRQFVDEAFKKAYFVGSFCGCLGVQYSSKQFDKFLDVGYGEKVKEGREYKIYVIGAAVPTIEYIDDKPHEDIVDTTEENNLVTCEECAQDGANATSVSDGAATVDLGQNNENDPGQSKEQDLGQNNEHHPTYAEVVAMGQSKDPETESTVEKADVEPVVVTSKVTVSEKPEQDLIEGDEKGAEKPLATTTPLFAAEKKGWFNFGSGKY